MTMAEQPQGFKYIVRIANTDLDGNKNVLFGVRKIKGIGPAFANMAVRKAGISPVQKLGNASEHDVKRLNDAIADIVKSAPSWMKNRPKDPETGDDKHLLTAELKFSQENDLRNMKKVKSYKGVRHSAGLPVRGQRTKSNFRRNKGKGMAGKKKADNKKVDDKK